MRRFASLSLAFVTFSSLLSACGDDIPLATDSAGSTGGSSGSGTGTTDGTSTTSSGTGTGTGEPTTTDPTTGGPTTGSTSTTTVTTGSTTETSESSTAGTTIGSTGSSSTGEPINCCEAKDGPGCGDPAIEACVCATDPTCCESLWSEECSLLVNKLECGSCPLPEGPCCEVGVGPGCAEDPVQQCVCGMLPDCCSNVWGEECVAAVDLFGCGMCGAPPKGECCSAHMGSGCLDPAIEACVCGLAPDCCNGAWTDECVAIVEQGGCGMCGGDEGMCCMVQDGPGCGDPAIEQCVCAQDPFCCQQQWDDLCVGEIEDLGCGMCGGQGGDCCSAGMGPGCGDLGIEQCVCNVAPSCCNDLWSDACAALVEPLGCGMCGGGGTSCCEPHDTPSCDDDMIAACVCAQDDFCCTTAWDGLCVAEVEMFGCGMCN